MRKENNEKKQRLFGRNLFTYIFFPVVAAVVIIIIFSIINYSSTYKANKLMPFVDKTTTEKFDENVFEKVDKIIDHSQFNTFGIRLKCTNYNEDQKKVGYELRIYKNENSPENAAEKYTYSLCLTAKWVGFIAYSNTSPNSITVAKNEKEALESTSSSIKKTPSINNIMDFPAKTNTWPFKVKVKEPTLYLYFSYTYKKNAETKTEAYIIKYEYKDLIPEDGGIRK